MYMYTYFQQNPWIDHMYMYNRGSNLTIGTCSLDRTPCVYNNCIHKEKEGGACYTMPFHCSPNGMVQNCMGEQNHMYMYM